MNKNDFNAEIVNPELKQFRGEGKDKEEWYSICSAHRTPKAGCPACKTGDWVNTRKQRREHLLYSYLPFVWRWWKNRKGSKCRQRLETIFPNLRQ